MILVGGLWDYVRRARGRCSSGLVRVGVQSAIAHPETEALLKKLMEQRGIPVPPPANATVCVTDLCKGDEKP